MAKQASQDLVHELATKTIVLHAATKKLEERNKEDSYFKTLQHTIEDSISLLRRLQIEVSEL